MICALEMTRVLKVICALGVMRVRGDACLEMMHQFGDWRMESTNAEIDFDMRSAPSSQTSTNPHVNSRPQQTSWR
jgi:hypothetical protein